MIGFKPFNCILLLAKKNGALESLRSGEGRMLDAPGRGNYKFQVLRDSFKP
jgi:hypothetical protein